MPETSVDTVDSPPAEPVDLTGTSDDAQPHEPTGRRRRKLGFGFWFSTVWVALILFAAVAGPWLPLQDPNKSDPCAVLAQTMINTGATPEQALMMRFGNAANPEQAQTLIDRGVQPDLPKSGTCTTPTLDARGGAFPSARHWLGTDSLSRDNLARLVHGARVAILVGVVAIAIGLAIGGAIGLAAGYFRGKVEAVLMTLVDIMLAFPALVLAIAIVAFAGQSLLNVCAAVAVVSTPAFARIARASTLTYAEREFVTAARVQGARHIRIMVREILPNAVLPLLAFGLVAVAVAIVVEGGLAFLGLSVPLPEASWGSMIKEGYGVINDRPMVALLPAGFIFVTALAFNILGDKFRMVFDVKDSAL